MPLRYTSFITTLFESIKLCGALRRWRRASRIAFGALTMLSLSSASSGLLRFKMGCVTPLH